MAEEVKNTTSNRFPACHDAFTNTQPLLNEWTNHSSFYVLFPSYYYTFVNMWVRRWLYWFDGFFPGIHDTTSGILSTRLATTLCYRLAEQVYGGGLLYSTTTKDDESKKALQFISGKWAKETNFANETLKAFILSSAGGTSFIKLNTDDKKDIWVDTWRIDQCYADFDFKGNITRSKFIIATYTKTIPQEDKRNQQNYYVIEERFEASIKDVKEYNRIYHDRIVALEIPPMNEGDHYVSYKVYRLMGVVNDFNETVNIGKPLNWEDINSDVKKSIKKDLGAFELNRPVKLPFRDIGVYAFKWTSFISNLPQLPYGESAIARIQTYLFEYDFMNSCMNTDFYLGRGRVMVPKSLQSPQKVNLNGNIPSNNYNQGLDSFLFTKVEYASTEDKKPEPIQFELRTQEWLTARNHLFEAIATALGISPSTLASYLQDSSSRTAREISSEESATALFVENKRSLFKDPINDAVNTVLLYYGYKDTVEVKFSKSGQTNTTLLIENTTRAFQSRLMSQYQAVKTINPDMTEEELTAELDRIKQDEEEAKSLNDYGGFNENIGGFNDKEYNSNEE